jgi:hypothetical protein
MRVLMAGLLAVSAMGISPALAQLDDPLSEYQQPGMNLPDPVADNGTHFSPSVATAGTANAGPTLASVNPDIKGCSTLNPCALATPALDNAAPRRQVSDRAKANSSS